MLMLCYDHFTSRFPSLFAWCIVRDRAREKYNRKQKLARIIIRRGLFDKKTDANTALGRRPPVKTASQPVVPADHVTACRSLWIILGCEMRQQGFIINEEYKDTALGLLSLSVLCLVGWTSGGSALGSCPSVRWVPMSGVDHVEIWGF